MEKAKKIRLAFVLFSVLLYSKFGFADTYEQKYNFYSENAYTITKQLCAGQATSLSFAWYGVKHVTIGNPKMIVKMSPELLGLIESMGYFQALRECYGNNHTKWNVFTIELFLSESIGKFAGLYLPFKGLSLIGKKLLLTRFALANPKLIINLRRTFVGLGIISTATYTAVEISDYYQKWLQSKRIREVKKQGEKALEQLAERDSQILDVSILALKSQIDDLSKKVAVHSGLAPGEIDALNQRLAQKREMLDQLLKLRS